MIGLSDVPATTNECCHYILCLFLREIIGLPIIKKKKSGEKTKLSKPKIQHIAMSSESITIPKTVFATHSSA